MKNYFKPFILLFLIINFVNFSCTQAIDLEKEKAALIQADKEWEAAARTNDMEKLWSFWDDKAVMLMSVDFTLKGKTSIKDFTTKVRKDPNFKIGWELKGAEVSPSAEMGYTYGVGTVTRTAENGEVMTNSKPYLVVWKKDAAGEWKGVIEN